MMKVLLVGTGYMAKEYARVLEALHITYDAIGRGEANCAVFRSVYPAVRVTGGGLEQAGSLEGYTHAIVATNVDALFLNCKCLIEQGIKKILVEKPGGLGTDEIRELAGTAAASGATVLLAYNRRFFATVLQAEKMIREDGGVLSFHFEFTEWRHTIESAGYSERIMQSLFVSHSSHLADTAFFLGGKPKEWSRYHSGALPWHDAAAVFSGAGISETNALFSYMANWTSPGRWGIEIMTASRRYVFRPLERLQVQEHRSVQLNELPVDDELDKAFKPGLYLQTRSFLEDSHERFCDIHTQLYMVEHCYNLMAGYQ